MAINYDTLLNDALKYAVDQGKLLGSVDDGGASFTIYNQNITPANISSIKDPSYDPTNEYMRSLYHGANLFSAKEFRNNLYTGIFRHGINSAINETIGTNCKEYLFFTKPNLNIFKQTDYMGTLADGYTFSDGVSGISFWETIMKYRKEIIENLEECCKDDPFNHLLQNMVISNLDIPSLDSDTIETATNIYGTNYSYRGSSEPSDHNPEFSLEFRDTKYLDIYLYFLAYEQYETLKHHGVVAPATCYAVNKIIHDQFSIYKFIVDEDGETILYWGKMYGVMPKGLPRDNFSNPNFESGLSHTINFKAAFYDDMNPEILADFNSLSAKHFDSLKYYIDPYNMVLDRPDMRIARGAFVYRDIASDFISDSTAVASNSPSKFVYKLKWKGNDRV